jgi:hypothetical protein
MLSDKTKEFIKEYTNTQGNALYKVGKCAAETKVVSYAKWITPEFAEKACEIEREEFMKKAHVFFTIHEPDEWVQSLGGVGHFFNKEKFFNDFIKAMED